MNRAVINRSKIAAAMSLFALCAIAAASAPISSADTSPTPEFTEYLVKPSTTQAGGHPDLNFVYEFTASGYIGFFEEGPCGHESCVAPRVVTQHMPAGFIGDPHVAPKCRLVDLAIHECPVDSQIGLFFTAPLTLHEGLFIAPLYNMETRPDQAGFLGTLAPLIPEPVFLELSSRTNSDYGLDSISSPIFTGFPLKQLYVELWGVPAAAVNNPHRFNLGKYECQMFSPTIIPPKSQSCNGAGALPGVAPAPFLQNPTTCGEPLTATAELSYYDGRVAHAEDPWPSMTGCQLLSFNPSQIVKPTTTRSDTASGVDLELRAPLTQNPDGASPSSIKRNRVTLPEGLSINPNAADGKVSCSDAQTSIGTLLPAACPEFSKVGTTEVNVAALPGPIFGGLYLGEPKPGEPYRLILTADGYATHVKLAGTVHADPSTGQLSTVFDIPQANIQEVNLHFFGSERGLLATPDRCGTFPVDNEFVPWDSELSTRHATSFITINGGPNGSACPSGPRPFNPTFQTGSASDAAGAHSPFSVVVDRKDGDQNLTGLTVKTPPGFSGTLKGIPYCPESAIARLSAPGHSGIAEQSSPACPAASQIGTATTGAGAGNHPLYVPGKVYLAGPYKGAPLSLVVVVPAVSGPYDLGNVAVRAAIYVDPVTAQVTTVSDPLPQIFEGIPLRARSIQVNLDRPSFALNPTNCDPSSVTSVILGDEGAVSNQAAHYQAANCADLPFGPKLGLKLEGGTKRTGHPALTATLTAKPGEANIASTVVTMPHSIFLDNAHINAPCTRVQYAAHACPPSSILGTAKAESPLIGQPLEGPVYLRSSSHELPDLVASLHGQIDIELDGRIDSSRTPQNELRIGARRAGKHIHPEPRRRQEGPAGQQRKSLQSAAAGQRKDDRAKRQADQQSDDAADTLQVQGAPQASRPA